MIELVLRRSALFFVLAALASKQAPRPPMECPDRVVTVAPSQRVRLLHLAAGAGLVTATVTFGELSGQLVRQVCVRPSGGHCDPAHPVEGSESLTLFHLEAPYPPSPERTMFLQNRQRTPASVRVQVCMVTQGASAPAPW